MSVTFGLQLRLIVVHAALTPETINTIPPEQLSPKELFDFDAVNLEQLLGAVGAHRESFKQQLLLQEEQQQLKQQQVAAAAAEARAVLAAAEKELGKPGGLGSIEYGPGFEAGIKATLTAGLDQVRLMAGCHFCRCI
jgi:hypothetical protein